jgi:deoxycytidylate deaminase
MDYDVSLIIILRPGLSSRNLDRHEGQDEECSAVSGEGKPMSFRKIDGPASKDFWDFVQKSTQEWRDQQPSWSREFERELPENRPLPDLITHPEPELVFAVASPVGTDLDQFERLFKDLVALFGYTTMVHRLSAVVERLHIEHVGIVVEKTSEYNRINSLMTAGNTLRRLSGRGDVLALYAMTEIKKLRKVVDKKPEPIPKVVHLLRSLKHPDEVEALRRIYGAGFFLIGLHGTEKQRLTYLTTRKGITPGDAQFLINRDRSEADKLGQQTRDTFTLSDVFVQSDNEEEQLRRFLDLVFGCPYVTPELDEQAMFLAYGASLRSGSLSRQVGAVFVSASSEIVATGANDVPCYGGGLYWPGPHDKRDHTQDGDSNDREIDEIIADVLARVKSTDISIDEKALGAELERRGLGSDVARVFELIESVKKAGVTIDEGALRTALGQSRVGDLTEYGRAVHAEMEALLACARAGISPRGGTLVTTTFPCHNCAKHIVAAGIERVVYVEPYPKSKALSLHSDSITLDEPSLHDPHAPRRVRFVPFVGVAARRYIDLFSMRLSGGVKVKRKEEDGSLIKWERHAASPRVRMAPYSYLERELIASVQLDLAIGTVEKNATEGRAAYGGILPEELSAKTAPKD